jgi:Flp pilus assembly protein TadG
MSVSSRRPTDRAQAAQSAVELALTLPAMVLLLVSVFNVVVLISDRVIASYATRQGARMAAQLGNGQGVLTTTQVDQQVLQAVLASATNLSFASISEVDVYRPSTADGSYLPTDPHDGYDRNGTMLTQTYPVSMRSVVPPNEDSIGVRVVWQYASPTGGYAITAQLSEYTVMKAAPVLQ